MKLKVYVLWLAPKPGMDRINDYYDAKRACVDAEVLLNLEVQR
jgi:hypothetical protein